MIVQAVRPAAELFSNHSFFVTNLVDDFIPKDIVRTYRKRGTMENNIKEVKSGFGFDQMNSHSFSVNQTKMIVNLFVYNMTNRLCMLCFPEGIDTIRIRLIKVVSRVIKPGRSHYFKLASSFVYPSFFWNILQRIQNLQLE